jgi:hypothetical protein
MGYERMQTNLDSLFKTQKSLETDGVWFKVSPETSFCLRRFGGGNAHKVKQAMAKYHKPHARLIENDALPIEEVNKIMAQVVASSCLIDWKGVVVDEKELPCTFENAVKLFTSLPELFNALFEYISGVESFKEDLGNS